MNPERRPSRLQRLMRLQTVATALDPADLGTAYGLDLSMAPAGAAAVEPSAESRGRRWMRRLSRRHNPGA